MSAMRRVLVIDDHPLVSTALAFVIENTFQGMSVQCLTCVKEVAAALAGIRGDAERPALAFVDLTLPGARGMELIENLHVEHKVPVIALSDDNSPDLVKECLQVGACGFVEKTAQMPVFTAAMTAVMSGGQFFPLDLIRNDNGIEQKLMSLTARQIDVLNLLIAGKPNKVIAATLGLAEGTVKNYVGILLQAFKVTSRAQLILAASRMNYRLRPILRLGRLPSRLEKA